MYAPKEPQRMASSRGQKIALICVCWYIWYIAFASLPTVRASKRTLFISYVTTTRVIRIHPWQRSEQVHGWRLSTVSCKASWGVLLLWYDTSTVAVLLLRHIMTVWVPLTQTAAWTNDTISTYISFDIEIYSSIQKDWILAETTQQQHTAARLDVLAANGCSVFVRSYWNNTCSTSIFTGTSEHGFWVLILAMRPRSPPSFTEM